MAKTRASRPHFLAADRHRAGDRGAPAVLGVVIAKVGGSQIAVGRERM